MRQFDFSSHRQNTLLNKEAIFIYHFLCQQHRLLSWLINYRARATGRTPPMSAISFSASRPALRRLYGMSRHAIPIRVAEYATPARDADLRRSPADAHMN